MSSLHKTTNSFAVTFIWKRLMKSKIMGAEDVNILNKWVNDLYLSGLSNERYMFFCWRELPEKTDVHRLLRRMDACTRFVRRMYVGTGVSPGWTFAQVVLQHGRSRSCSQDGRKQRFLRRMDVRTGFSRRMGVGRGFSAGWTLALVCLQDGRLHRSRRGMDARTRFSAGCAFAPVSH